MRNKHNLISIFIVFLAIWLSFDFYLPEVPAGSVMPSFGIEIEVAKQALACIPGETPSMVKGPYLIYEDVNTDMTVLWQTKATKDCTLRWYDDANCTNQIGFEETDENNTTYHQHEHTITGLTRGQLYYYRVTIENDAEAEPFYPGSFRAAPLATATSVKFMVSGDCQGNHSEQDNLSAQINSVYTTDSFYRTFLLQTGDRVDEDSETDWDRFFNHLDGNTQQILADLPSQSCLGNHEMNPGSQGILEVCDRYWPYPYVQIDSSDKHYWSFDYGPAHIVVVDQFAVGSYQPDKTNKIGAEQLAWIEDDLANAENFWKFIVLHQPGYSAYQVGGDDHSENLEVQGAIQDLSEKFGVDIVFAGHQHYYARSEVSGIMHVTNVGGLKSDRLRYPDLPHPDYNKFVKKVNSFNKIHIDGPQLTFSPIDIVGNQIENSVTRNVLRKADKHVITSTITSVSTAIVKLEWRGDFNADEHKVYLGTTSPLGGGDLEDEITVADANFIQNSTYPTLEVVENLDDILEQECTVSSIVPGTTYYWRVDQLDSDNNVITGEEWSFNIAVPPADVIYVSSEGDDSDGLSWYTAYHDLQDALDDAVAGDQIWVAEGIYYPTTNDPDPRKAYFRLVNEVETYGGFAGGESSISQRDCGVNVTVLSGDLNEDDPTTTSDNCYHVLDGSDTNSTTVLDGFTIRGGNANGAGNSNGGGIWGNVQGSWLRINQCVIQDNVAAGNGGGIYGIEGDITNCIITGNTAALRGGGLADCHGKIINCVVAHNDGDTGGGLDNCDAQIINCTIIKNTAATANEGGGLNDCEVTNNADAEITNCIIYANQADDVDNQLENCVLPTYCGIQDCLRTDGNISDNPYFLDSGLADASVETDVSDLAGLDGILCTKDDGYCLDTYSPCVDNGNNDALDYEGDDADDITSDIHGGLRRDDVPEVEDISNFTSPIVDRGASEIQIANAAFPYATSFETNQEYSNWTGNVSIATGHFYDDPQNVYSKLDYKYAKLYYGSESISREFSNFKGANQIIRISCVPSAGSMIKMTDDSDNFVAGLQFEDNKIWAYVYNDSTSSYQWENTGVAYNSIANNCRAWLDDYEHPDPTGADGYTYERCWIELEISIDWANHTYDISWSYWDPDTKTDVEDSVIKTGAVIDSTYDSITEISFETTASGSDFRINRISVSDETDIGGVYGVDEDIYITYPTPDIRNPLMGHCAIGGSIWYERLGEYRILYRPVDGDGDPDPLTIMGIPIYGSLWTIIDRGYSPKRDTLLGYIDTWGLRNGDINLKIEVYDDIGRLYTEDIITKDVTYHKDGGGFSQDVTNTVNVDYPIIGRAKGKGYHYEESTDITINWPGSFPFEFKRTYDDNLIGYLYPLFFGWTHNHNIRVIENCTNDWVEDDSENPPVPAADDNGLGFGRLWFQKALGSRMFMGEVHTVEGQVIYKPIDSEIDYIIRTSNDNGGGTFSVSYVHYAPDGMKMVFGDTDTLDILLTPGGDNPYTPYEEGAVDWQIAKGLDEQQDRFGNKLTYLYNNDMDGRDTEDEQYLMEIANNRTPAKLEFEDTLQLFGTEGPRLYEKIKLTDSSYDAYVMSFSYSGWYKCEKLVVNNQGTGDGSAIASYWMYSIDEEGVALSSVTLPYEKLWHVDVPPDKINLEYYPDGSLKKIVKNYPSAINSWALDWIELYSYQHGMGFLETQTEYRASCYWSWHYLDNEVLFRTSTAIVNPYGAMTKQITTTHETTLDGEVFDPSEQKPYYMWVNAYDYCFHAGGGGVTDVEYFYTDGNFPHKPTTILEYIDVDAGGDGVFESQSTRKTTMAYDTNGNMTEQRKYVDDTDYVLTEYEYHDTYNFPIKQTTWKNYQTGVTTPSSPDGQRVEKQWRYGDADGTLVSGGSDGDYLVEERTLLDDNDTATEPDDLYADTFYEYYEFDDSDDLDDADGLLKIKTDPEGNENFYKYSAYGLLLKEWHGATITSGQPQGNPQKRHWYNDYGLKELEADHLGKVTMHVYSINSVPVPPQKSIWTAETRTYFDTAAMSKADTGTGAFLPSTYDDPGTTSDDSDYEARTIYEEYHYCEKPAIQEFPTGGKLYLGYFHDGETVVQNWAWESSTLSYTNEVACDADGRSLVARQNGANVGPLPDSYDIATYFVYDSMDRLLHKYEYDYEIGSTGPSTYVVRGAPVIKHTEYGYYGTGQKRFEKVYKVVRGGTIPSPVFTSTLEKYTEYYYDVLDRLIRQVEDANDVTCLNITTDFGYDAVGNRIYVINPEGKVIITDYDNANRKIAEYFAATPVYVSGTDIVDVNTMTDEQNPLVATKKEVEYYDDNKVKKVTSYDYNGSTILACSEYTYDARGRISQAKEQIDATPTYAETNYAYSDGGGMTGKPSDSYDYHIKIEDARDKNTWISLHPLAKPQKIVYPSGDYEEIEYYGFGLPSSKAVWDTGGNPEIIEYAYDEFGKLETVTYPENGGTLEYEYTARTLGKYGKVKTITDKRAAVDRPGAWGSTYEFDYYDWSGNLLSYENPDGIIITYDYNTAWNRKKKITVVDPAPDPDPDVTLYSLDYDYDPAGRLTNVTDSKNSTDVAVFDYDENGNRTDLDYYLEGSTSGDKYGIDYTHNDDNFLTNIATTSSGVTSEPDYAFDADTAGDIDGTGRLWLAEEAIHPDGLHKYAYTYDMRSQLLSAEMKDWDDPAWSPVRTYGYQYDDDGNINTETIDSTSTGTISYNGDLMTAKSGDTLEWDKNGQLTLVTAVRELDIKYNWDGKMRSTENTDTDIKIAVKYDPMGNRVRRTVTDESTQEPTITKDRKYVVDIVGKLPAILCELDASDDDSLTNSYIYADAQILAQYTYDSEEEINEKFYYVHDRLGSVRLMVDYDDATDTVGAVNTYTYNPFGDHYIPDTTDSTYNPFQFTGQWLDSEIDQYYLRARMYDPKMMRFTTRDPVNGKFKEPMALHKYLYCTNDPLNRIDPKGELGLPAHATQGIIDATVVYNEVINCAAYAADSGNWAYFDLATNFAKFMPIALGLGMLNPGNIYNPLEALEGALIENAILFGMPTYELDQPFGGLMSGWTSAAFQAVFFLSIEAYDISYEEMDEFYEWKGL